MIVEALTVLGTAVNTGLLLRIYFMLGQHDQKHESHERRLTLIEERIDNEKDFKRA